MKKKNEVATTQETNVPAPLQTAIAPARGFEGGVSQDDLIIPRAKLIQAMSPEIQEDLAGVVPGAIINSLTKEILPKEFIPIFFFKNHIRFNGRSKKDAGFDPNLTPGAIIWRSNDPNDPRVLKEAAFGENGESPLALTFLNFFSYFPGVPMPVIVSFSKTSFKTGKQLLSLAKFCGGDMFSRKYKLFSTEESNDMGTYSVLKVASAADIKNPRAAFASPEEFAICEQMWKDFSPKVKDIKVHDSEVDEAQVVEEGGKRPY